MKEEKTPSQSLYFIDDALNDDSDVKKQSVQKSEKSKDTTDFDYKTFLKTVPNRPGSYRMYDKNETVIYVGKAKDLKKRLSQYFLKGVDSIKTRALVSHIAHIEFTVTFSETEALILENNLIKKYQPRYNILLRDDKSYPYILLTKDKHPGLFYHRGAKRIVGDYFGPFPDSSAVKESLRLLQKIFPIRQCADTVYAHRSRPCLMAQLGKCLAPCVPMGEKGEENYAKQVELVKLFLRGQNQELLNNLTVLMQSFSKNLQFEEAAKCRDQLLALRRVQEAQSVSSDIKSDIDVIGHAVQDGLACVHVLFIRKGRILGTRSYYPKLPREGSLDELMMSFLSQFYLSENRSAMFPQEIVIDVAVNEIGVLQNAINQVSGREVKFLINVRAERAKYLTLAKANAKASLTSKIASSLTAQDRINSLEKILNIKDIHRMECFDISHTQGELTVASCVVFDREGPDTSRYRRFNIEGITPGDDFAAMHQVLTRRFKDPDHSEIPDLVFIDGGPGQLKQAEEVLTESFLHAKSSLPKIVAVAKGEGRKEGLETLIMGFTHERYHLDLSDPALQLILHIRDESHRFAITGHRGRRSKARRTSALEGIEGVGTKRRQALLQHLGGRQEVMRAGVDELAKVPGISKALAQKIYDALHAID
ncbi:excinuclease ABC subunit UvrC [Succinatimonas hippei]|uniref:excinuclease ABC subunit UvrC n=2 Tax=Succinatimonas hippei TaxID=626938 RepID=UPI0023F791BC|nr:excinuclease ABC subunit UvrC [Succinatimonas hippei]MDM8120502.1 excinuclease ABC subunit UvrC [Succinatimonas hippei]